MSQYVLLKVLFLPRIRKPLYVYLPPPQIPVLMQATILATMMMWTVLRYLILSFCVETAPEGWKEMALTVLA